MELSDEENEVGRDNLNSGDEGGYRSDEAEEDPGNNEDEEGEGGKGRRIDPSTSKKKVTRNPQPKLNAERIQGPKGVQTIEKYFESFKFHGKGHEKADLDRVMKRLEHWAHRLFPKYRFDDFLEKMETLGGKKNVQVFLKKYRLDMITADDDIIDRDRENGETQEEQSVPDETPVDEFDKLIAEQIEKQRQVTNEPPARTNKPTGYVLGSAGTSKPSELSEEVKARIEANRKLAIERKMARLKREEEEKKRKLEEARYDAQISDSQVSSTTEISWSQEQNEKKKLKVDAHVSESGVSSTKESSHDEDLIPHAQPTGLKIVENIVFRAEDSTADDFDPIVADKIGEEETEKRKTLEYFEQEIPIIGAEEELKRTEEPIDTEIPIIGAEEELKRTEESMDKEIPIIGAEEELKRTEEPMDKESLAEVHSVAAIENDAVAKNDIEPSANRSKENHLPKVNGKSKKGPHRPLTNEELLMEIEGAIEEIINKSTRRST